MKQIQEIAGRYANAFVAEIRESEFAPILEQVQVLVEVFGYKEVISELCAPGLTFEAQKQIIRSTFGHDFDERILRLLELVFENGRASITGRVLETVLDRIKLKSNIKTGTVYSPVDLSKAELTDLENKIGAAINSRAELTVVKDATLIAGYKIEIGDRLFDNSIKTQLDKVHQILAN